MILIDRTKEAQRIFLTLDGRDFDGTLHIKNDQNRQSFSLFLPQDSSPAPGRYNLFAFNLSDTLFVNLPEGYYTYEAKTTKGEVIESGKLRLIGAAYVPDTIAPDNINDTLIFKPNGE